MKGGNLLFPGGPLFLIWVAPSGQTEKVGASVARRSAVT